MSIAKKSLFKEPEKAKEFLKNWVNKLEKLNKTNYESVNINTSFGTTNIWCFNRQRTDLDSIVIFPGTRTHALFWDFDNMLVPIKENFRVFIIDINGQPSLSDGYCPNMKNNDFGIWGTEIITELGLEKTHIAGASLGGIICLKTCLVSPDKIKNVFLLNPAAFISFSMSPKNMYANLLPVFLPSQRTVNKFLRMAVINRNVQQISDTAYQLLVDFEVYALKQHKYKGSYPSPLQNADLKKIRNRVFLLEGTTDTLFPYKKNVKVAKQCLQNLVDVKVFESVGHGIEIHREALSYISEIMGV